MGLRELLGYKLVFGVTGPELTAEDIALFKETKARGLILYRRNYKSTRQLKQLISDLEEHAGHRLLVCVDHEGGRVIMFGGGVTVFPDNYAFGLADAEGAVLRQGEIEARELRALGADVNFAPVLDILTDAYSPGVLSRSYGTDAEKVCRLARARIEGMQFGGISATAKHFPGKGHASVDAHLKLPVINSTLEEMEAKHLKPFMTAIESGVDCIMSSHPLYQKIDPDNIATFSKKIITGLLREKYGYKGVIVSDDLEMGAIAEVSNVEQAIVKADMSGHDLLLVCHASKAQRRAYEALLKAYEDGTLQLANLEKSAERIEALHKKRPNRFEPEMLDSSEGRAIAAETARAAAAVIQRGKLELPISLSKWRGGKSILLYPRFSDISDVVMIEPEIENLARHFQSHMPQKGFFSQTMAVPMNPQPDDVERIKKAVRATEFACLFLWDAGLSEGWRQVLSLAQENATYCVVVLLRDMFDKRFLKPDTCAATGYGFRRCQVDAVLDKLFIP